MNIEIIKIDKVQVEDFLILQSYQLYPMDINILAFHQTEPGVTYISSNANGINLTI